MAEDKITRTIPQDGWSPIICHKVPIAQTITNIVGDKGPGEIYEDGFIKNFHAKIDWQGQYGGSRVPADIITESSTDYGETWTMNEIAGHEEGSFELDYEGHERDFEVKVVDREGCVYVENFGTVLPFTPPSEYIASYNSRTVSYIYVEGDSAYECLLMDDNLFNFFEEGAWAEGKAAGYSDEMILNMIESLLGPVRPYKGKFLISYPYSLEGKHAYWAILKEGGEEHNADDYESSGVPVNISYGDGSAVYIKYRGSMNGQELEDTDGSFDHEITVADYPVKLEVDAHYEDNYGGHEIGNYTLNSAKVTMKSGEVKNVEVGASSNGGADPSLVPTVRTVGEPFDVTVGGQSVSLVKLNINKTENMPTQPPIHIMLLAENLFKSVFIFPSEYFSSIGVTLEDGYYATPTTSTMKEMVEDINSSPGYFWGEAYDLDPKFVNIDEEHGITSGDDVYTYYKLFTDIPSDIPAIGDSNYQYYYTFSPYTEGYFGFARFTIFKGTELKKFFEYEGWDISSSIEDDAVYLEAGGDNSFIPRVLIWCLYDEDNGEYMDGLHPSYVGASAGSSENGIETPSSATTWKDKDGFQTQTWSYTENGRTVTAQVGANITALRDVKIRTSLGELAVEYIGSYLWNEEETYHTYKVNLPPETYEERHLYTDTNSDISFTLFTKSTLAEFVPEDHLNLLDDDHLYLDLIDEEKEIVDNAEGFGYRTDEEDESTYVPLMTQPIFKEGTTISKTDFTVTMTRNDSSTYETTDYWMPNNYPFGRGKQSVTVQKGSLSTTAPVTVAYVTKVEVGNMNEDTFVKSSFYEYGSYIEPTHYKVHYECYDGTEGFDEIKEIDGEWISKVESKTAPYYTSTSESNGSIGITKVYEILGLSKEDECYNADWEQWCIFTEDGDRVWIGSSNTEGSLGQILGITGIEPSEKVYYGELYVDGELYNVAPSLNGLSQLTGQLYYPKIVDGEWVKGDPLPMLPIGEGLKVIGEYGSEVGIFTLNNKNYIYRVGFEPVDEPNYLFIKDFKDIPFNYDLVNCREPELQEPAEGEDGNNDSVVFLGKITVEGMDQYYYKVPSPPDNLIHYPTYEGGLTYADLNFITESAWNSGAAILAAEEFVDLFKSYGLSVSAGDWTMTNLSPLDLDHLVLAYDRENPFYSKGIAHSEAEEGDEDGGLFGHPIFEIDEALLAHIKNAPDDYYDESVEPYRHYAITERGVDYDISGMKYALHVMSGGLMRLSMPGIEEGLGFTLEDNECYSLVYKENGVPVLQDRDETRPITSPLYYIDAQTGELTNIPVEFY